MEKYESILKFEKYVVNEISFVNNSEFKKIDEKIPVDLKIKKKATHYESGRMEINLIVNIFENAKENNYPYEVIMNLTGYFYIEGEKTQSLEKNAVAILYPYIRAILSTYTVNSNVVPLVLPVINVNKLIEEQQ